MYNSYYGLSFNPFDKQQLKEKDHFISRDFTEMTNRLNYLKDIRGIGVFTARPFAVHLHLPPNVCCTNLYQQFYSS